MPSEPAGRPGPVTRLADLLAEARVGVRPGGRELAELLWLAGQLDPDSQEGAQSDAQAGGEPSTAPEPPARQPSDRTGEPAGTTPAPQAPAPGPQTLERPPLPPPGPRPRVPLHLPGPAADRDGGRGHTPLMAPAPPMLSHPLALQRALRPLKRTVDAPSGLVLDEEATAHRIATVDGEPRWWLPVLRPTPERWLRLNLVHDTGPTMPVWRPLVRELRDALAQSGIFRTVAVHRADPDGRVHHDGAPAPVDGRTVTLVLSDCMGPQWRPGPAGERWYAQLRHWATRMPLAVVQPLPERLWRTTALPTTPGLLSAPGPAAPASSLAFQPYDTESGATKGAFPLPVLEPTALWLGHWSQLVADAGGRQLPGSVALLSRNPATRPTPEADRLDPEELVLRFRALASPEAFRLAGHLAVGRPELPVMRLVQAAIEPTPQPQHLAEVILSGLLTTAPSGRPGAYDFRPGVRELLLRTLPRTAHSRMEQLLARVGKLIDRQAGVRAGEFAAVAPGGGRGGPAPEGEAFATVREESVLRLGGRGRAAEPESGPEPRPLIAGRYRLERALGEHGKYWLARNERAGDQVVLRLHDRNALGLPEELPGSVPEHPNLVRVLDAGTHDGKPFLVMEYVEGPPLSTYRTHARETVEFGHQLLDALTVLHEAGIVHGRLVAENVIVAPDGTPKISGLALHERPGSSRERDLRALGSLLSRLADHQRWDHGTDMPSAFRSMVRALKSGMVPYQLIFTPGPPYRVLGPLGLGGVMWRARHYETGQDVAIQTFPSGFGQGDPDDADFGTTARRLAAFQHENVVRVLDWGMAHGMPYLVTEQVATDISLKELLDSHGGTGLPDDLFMPIAAGLAAAVLALHAGGLRHGDLTAAHILVAEGGRPVVCGFALGANRSTSRRDDLRRLGGHVQAMVTGLRPTYERLSAPELAPDPSGWHRELADVINDLRFARVGRAAQAAEQLTRLSTRTPGAREPDSRAPRFYRLFGRVRIEESGATKTVGTPGSAEESLLCALLLSPGQIVRYDELREDARLRERWQAHARALEEELGRETLVAGDDGAVLHLRDGDTTDIQRIDELTDSARQARYVGDLPLSRLQVQRALDLMQEEPLPGQRDAAARAAQRHLRELLLTLQLTRAELDLELGQFQLVVDDLEGVLLQHPGHPDAVRLRMLALRALNRTAEALDVYEDYESRHQSPADVDPVLAELHRELRAAHAPTPAPTGVDLPGTHPLTRAETVILGFDGPLVRLYANTPAATAARQLTQLITELRDVEESLSGVRIEPVLLEGTVHPLDVLRTYARHRVGEDLRRRLDEIEMKAVRGARPNRQGEHLLHALTASGRRVAVASDTSHDVMAFWMGHRSLTVPGGIIGRPDDLGRLMPDPASLLRALAPPGLPAPEGAMIGSSLAEYEAARRLGLGFIGYAYNRTTGDRLRSAGCGLVVDSLDQLVELIRSE
ncbi:SAV_2336 N-terminal domain-related protein [Streptomyces monticola]|uniref:SAV_2336 N-terminal domain-related protein n=1 Tax=Streptomyces monticola TaxID=2666263 RepID=A0ABW2JRY9_9ACTN